MYSDQNLCNISKFKTRQDRRHERVPTEIKTNEFLKLVLGHQLCPDFQGQFIPDGRTLICKQALTIGLGFDIEDSKNVSAR